MSRQSVCLVSERHTILSYSNSNLRLMLGTLVLPAGMKKVRFQNSKPLDSHDQL